jgi:hypothetical protein
VRLLLSRALNKIQLARSVKNQQMSCPHTNRHVSDLGLVNLQVVNRGAEGLTSLGVGDRDTEDLALFTNTSFRTHSDFIKNQITGTRLSESQIVLVGISFHTGT